MCRRSLFRFCGEGYGPGVIAKRLSADYRWVVRRVLALPKDCEYKNAARALMKQLAADGLSHNEVAKDTGWSKSFVVQAVSGFHKPVKRDPKVQILPAQPADTPANRWFVWQRNSWICSEVLMGKRKERIALMVTKGGFVPADDFSRQRLRERDYRIGDVVSGDLKKPRNPRFNGLVHVFGQLLADNIDEFSGMNAHRVLKRLQWEANVACEEIGVKFPDGSKGVTRIPQSLAFDQMDDTEFSEVFSAFCRHVAEEYWPGMEAEQVAAMVEMAGRAA